MTKAHPWIIGFFLCTFAKDLTFAATIDHIKAHRFTAASLGIANATASIATDAAAFYFNPAGLSRNSEYRLITVGQRGIDGFKNWGVQASVIDAKTEDPLHWGFLYNFGRSKGIARFHDMVLATSYNFNQLVLVGIGQRVSNFDQRSLTPEKWTYGANAGILVFATDYLALGASVDNIYRSYENSATNPIIFRAGVSGNFQSLRVGVDLERDQSKSQSFMRVGGEYQSNHILLVRAGAFSDSKRNDLGYTLGMGIKAAEAFQLDFGFMDQLKSSIFVYCSNLIFRF